MRVNTDEGESTEVQMGPLIDCVFLLLIFFIVIAVTKKSIKELGIRLPNSAQAQKVKPKDKDLVIRVTSDGKVHVGPSASLATRQTWHKAIEDAAKAKNVKVRLETDRGTQMQHMMPVWDKLTVCGLSAHIRVLME